MAEIVDDVSFRITAQDATATGVDSAKRNIESLGSGTRQHMVQFAERTEKMRQALFMLGSDSNSVANQMIHWGGILSSMIGKFSPLEWAITGVSVAIAKYVEWTGEAEKRQKRWTEEIKKAGEEMANMSLDFDRVAAHQFELLGGKATDWTVQFVDDIRKKLEDVEIEMDKLDEEMAGGGDAQETLHKQKMAADKKLALEAELARRRTIQALWYEREGARQLEEQEKKEEADRLERQKAAHQKRLAQQREQEWDYIDQKIAMAQDGDRKLAAMKAAELAKEKFWARGLLQLKKETEERNTQIEDAANDERNRKAQEAYDLKVSLTMGMVEATAELMMAVVKGEDGALKAFINSISMKAYSEAIYYAAKAVGAALMPDPVEQAKAGGYAAYAAGLFAVAATLGGIGAAMGGGGGGGSSSAPASPQSFSPTSGEGGPTNIYYINGHQINTSTGYDKVFADGSRRYEQSQKPKSKRSRF